MHFLNPWGLLYGATIGIVIILYMLKPKHEKIMVSSTYLWDKTIKDMEVSRPWQKLKKNILMLLQIFIIILIVLAIARPYIAATAIHGDVVVVLDCSASMQANDISPTRLDEAKAEILKLIDGMLPGQRMAIITMGIEGQIVTEGIEDKADLKRFIEDIQPENGGGSESEALSMANAISKDLVDAKVIVYTDKQISIDDDNYHVITINGDGVNVAMGAISYIMQEDEIIALSKINSFGYRGKIVLECYADDSLVDVKEAYIEDDDTIDIYWHGIPKKTENVRVFIDADDNLDIDNQAYVVIEGEPIYRGLLVTDGNIFLERALEQYRGLEIAKTTPAQAENLSGYDLYILDDVELKNLPNDGHIIVFGINDDTQMLGLDEGYEFNPSRVEAKRSILADEILTYTRFDDVYISRATAITPPSWLETILESNATPLLLAGEQNNRKTSVFLFSIHKSDLPLKPDFPILMQNIVYWMLPNMGIGDGELYAGDGVNISAMPSARSVEIIDPNGNKHIEGPLRELGIYKVVQNTDRGEYIDSFAVNFPVHTQSNLKPKDMEQKIETRSTTKRIMTRELWKYALYGALALLLLEWWVYSYGY